jgi:uncharacterized membrane protein
MTPTALVTQPLGILAILLVIVALADWLGRIGHLRKVGAAVIVIILGALLANLRVIPPASAGGPVYDPIFASVIPGAIFLVLLEVNIAALRRAGGAMLLAFLLGAVGTAIGVLAAASLTPLGAMLGRSDAAALAGMYAGTYIGGSANFNAVAIGYGIGRDGGLYTAATVVDNVMTDIWILITLAMPMLLAKTGLFARRAPASTRHAEPTPPRPLPPTLAIGVPLALASMALVLSDAAAAWFDGVGIPIPSILIVTTLALILAQLPATARLTQAAPIGLWGMYLFLAVVGANADLAALSVAGALAPVLFAYVGIIFAVHAVVLIGGGWLLRIEPVMLAISSSANIGGSATAFVLAEAEGRHDLVLPALLVGSLGTALGTYAGFGIAALVG